MTSHITSELACVCWRHSRMAITNHFATVFWLLSGVASCFISRFISGFIRDHREGAQVFSVRSVICVAGLDL